MIVLKDNRRYVDAMDKYGKRTINDLIDYLLDEKEKNDGRIDKDVSTGNKSKKKK